MKLFESSYKKNYDYYERYYNTETNKSESKKIEMKSEWFEESSRGTYTSILDDSIKLVRCQGKEKDGREHYSFFNPMYRNIRENYWKDSLYNKDARCWYFDMETMVGKNPLSKGFPVPEKALEEINLIQVYDNKLDTMIVLGLREWKHQDNYKFDYKVQYIKCSDEIELLKTYLKIFKKLDPTIIYAWNGNGFDYPYLFNRMKNIGLDTNDLSNYNETKLNSKEKYGKMLHSLKSDGHYYIDLMEVYKKFVFKPRASYSLDFISEVELNENKVNHSEYAKFQDFYDGNYTIPSNPTDEQMNSLIYKEAVKGNIEEVKELAHSDFVYYGIKDTYLVKRLDEKLNFTALLFMVSEKMGVLVDDGMGTVKPWTQYIMNRSYINNQAMPPRQHSDETPSIVGGYVREPEVGKHNWILSADVSSMYPLLGITGFNMSPETFIPKHNLPSDLRDILLQYFNDENEQDRLKLPEKVWNRTTSLLKKYNYSMGINGAVFDNNNGEGMLPELVLDIYNSRKIAKQTQFKYEKRAILIEGILHENNDKSMES